MEYEMSPRSVNSWKYAEKYLNCNQIKNSLRMIWKLPSNCMYLIMNIDEIIAILEKSKIGLVGDILLQYAIKSNT